MHGRAWWPLSTSSCLRCRSSQVFVASKPRRQTFIHRWTILRSIRRKQRDSEKNALPRTMVRMKMANGFESVIFANVITQWKVIYWSLIHRRLSWTLRKTVTSKGGAPDGSRRSRSWLYQLWLGRSIISTGFAGKVGGESPLGCPRRGRWHPSGYCMQHTCKRAVSSRSAWTILGRCHQISFTGSSRVVKLHHEYEKGRNYATYKQSLCSENWVRAKGAPCLATPLFLLALLVR